MIGAGVQGRRPAGAFHFENNNWARRGRRRAASQLGFLWGSNLATSFHPDFVGRNAVTCLTGG